MPPPLKNFITAAIPDQATYTVALRWADGTETSSSFRHLLGHGIMRRLSDPAFFARVAVGERGRSLVWPDDIEFCADALWFEAHPQDNPERNRTPGTLGMQPIG